MSWHGWLIFCVVALPLAGFLLWVSGQYLRARREETETVLRKGVPAEAEITGYAPHLLGAFWPSRMRVTRGRTRTQDPPRYD